MKEVVLKAKVGRIPRFPRFALACPIRRSEQAWVRDLVHKSKEAMQPRLAVFVFGCELRVQELMELEKEFGIPDESGTKADEKPYDHGETDDISQVACHFKSCQHPSTWSHMSLNKALTAVLLHE